LKKFLSMLGHKMDIAKEDSDFTYFFSLLVTGEAVTKMITLLSVASLNNDKDRHQYRILHNLVRASGIGEWSKAIDDLLVGTASQHLSSQFRIHQAELTKKVSSDEWQFKAVEDLTHTLNALNINIESSAGKKDLKSWFRLFTELRNKTRGHGAIKIESASNASVHLSKSINLIIDNLSLFDIPMAYIRRNLSGKYRVTDIVGNSVYFSKLKKSYSYQLEDGIYMYLDDFRKLPLIVSDSDLNDFYISNGGFTNRKYELLSYCTDDKKQGDSSVYMIPKGQLPPSESDGLGELEDVGNCFSNVPSLSYEYIRREELEDKLFSLLKDDRRTVVTLLGRGGIGKTSLALKVIPWLYDTRRFDAVIWFSSRDIDLKISGAKLVTANVISDKDISKCYCSLVLSHEERNKKGFDSIEYFQKQLTESDIGSCLFVFDNFETTENPFELFKWIDTYIRNPNKVLITTRLRDFIGDYPINVHGMSLDESEKLIRLTADNLGTEGSITQDLIDDIYSVSAGHPYIIKIMLGELSKQNMRGSLPKIVAGSEEVLTALFERTYAALNPCAQRVYLTLASWNSAVPRLALEAILMVSIDEPLEVEKAIDNLLQYSMAEEFKSNTDGHKFIVLPYAAMAFGAKKLRVSPLKAIISNDVRMLQRFGPVKVEDKNLSLSHHFSRFLGTVQQTETQFENNRSLIERICLSHLDGWLLISRWLEESGDIGLLKFAKEYLLRYLENETSELKKVGAWRQLADLSRELGEPLDEVHSLIEASQYSEVEFSDLSNVANKINHMLNKHELELENNDIKKELLSRLFNVIWRRRAEADAVDFSRMAWLALHLERLDDAKELIVLGLSKDPSNRYCQKLSEKMESRY